MATSISALARRAAAPLLAAAWMSQSVAAAEPQPSPPTILSTALVVARNQAVPRMTTEDNLTWQGSQLRSLTQLLSRAGRLDEALALIDGLDTPDRVKVEAFVPIVEAAMRAHDEARARAVTKRIESFSEWTVPVALGELVVARHQAGDEVEALRLAKEIDEPSARAEAYFALGRYDDMLRAAQKIAPEMMHIASPSGPFWEDEYDARQAVLLRLVTAFVERGDMRRARAAMKALDTVPDRSASQFRARALLELARKDRVVQNLKAAEAAVDEGPSERLGELLAAADSLSQIAERFAMAGEPAAAAGAVQKAVALLSPRESDDTPEVGTEILCETMVRIARAERTIGQRAAALALLERAYRAASAMAIRPSDPADAPAPAPAADAADSGTDWHSMSLHDQVEAKLRVAVELESAAEPARAEVVLRDALTELASIPSAEWRGYSWRSLIEIHRAAGLLDRGVELLTADRATNADKAMAVFELSAAEFLAEPAERRANLLALLPSDGGKAGLTHRLALELDARHQRDEAGRMVEASLEILATKPAEWVLGVVAMGAEAPGADQPGDAKQQELLQGLLDAVGSQPVSLTLLGTIRSIEPADTGDPLKRWVVATHVDQVVSGEFSGKEFAFAIHSPAQSGLEVGKQIRFRADWTGKAYVVDPLQWRTAQ